MMFRAAGFMNGGARVEAAQACHDAADDAVITLDLGDGRSLKISASASPALVTAALQALR
jgi:hypothetical protein